MDEMRKGFEDQRKAGINVDWFTWQIAWHDAVAALASAPAQHSASTDRLSVGQSIEFQPGMPGALYTMDQMRDYALAFHKSRVQSAAVPVGRKCFRCGHDAHLGGCVNLHPDASSKEEPTS